VAKAVNLNAVVIDPTVGTSETTISHTLGRKPVEGLIIDRLASAKVWRGATAWTSESIFLQASASVTISLLLF